MDPLLQQRSAAARRPVAAPPPAAAPGRAPRRVRPAHGAKVLSLAASVATTLGLTAAFAQASHDTPSTLELATPASTDTPEVVAATTATTSPDSPDSTTSTTVVPQSTSGQIIDGTYVGEASTNRWGTVQVQAVYVGGQLVDVQILSYPDADRKSVQINERALPQLIENAIAIQSADVDSISGATYTVNSYRESLQSAIDAALAASGQA
ncbi:MAG TPA: FMN-binding protein [Acidimicrobiaceae bacterium]|nr:FMN-binding protein [Acidimicrobiaceae bacterium]